MSINYKKLEKENFYFPEIKELQDSNEYRYAEDLMCKKYACDKTCDLYIPIKNINLPIISLTEKKLTKSWLPYIYKEDNYFLPREHLKEGNVDCITFDKKNYFIHYKYNIKKNSLMSERYSTNCELEEMFINVPKNNTEVMISRKEYKKDIIIEIYDIKEKYYHPEKIIKNKENKIINYYFKKEDKKIKEWLKENDISPFFMSVSDIRLFNINFESIFDEKEEIEIEI